MSKDRNVIDRYERAYEKDRLKEEALKENMTKSIAAILKKNPGPGGKADRISKEFMESGRSGSGTADRQNILDTVSRGTGMDEFNWGSEVTGEYERDKYGSDDDE